MKSHTVKCCISLICAFLVFGFMASFANAEVQHHEFVVQQVPVKRLCKTVYVMTVNGQFPGPNIEVMEGDTVVIKVTNAGQYNATLHWHGIRQMRTPWADGPEYVTQCPIKPGQTYTYRFTIEQQEGTLWWHAHSRWLRATIYGAFVIRPRLGASYPFVKPAREYPVLLGEWWNRDPMSVLRQATITGAAPNVSNGFTINGQPGDLYRCSSQDTVVFAVNAGETVLLRIINAALNQQLFFAIGNHRMTVVGADASYTKPFTTNYIMIGPGQTTDVLVTADQPPARYYMAAHAYASAPGLPFDNTTTTAIFQYQSAGSGSGSGAGAGPGAGADCGSRKGNGQGNVASPVLPPLPAFNDTNSATAFTLRVKSPSKVDVPLEIDESLFFTVALGLINCSRPSFNCQGPNNTRFTASMNNVSFVFPRRTSLLQAYYQGNANGVFTTDFPAFPPLQFDYTGNVSRGLWQPAPGTKLFRLKYGSSVQLVLQGTSIFRIEEHPMHLHGYQFYVVGQGFGNFDPRRDPANFNLVDPPLRNTIGTPPGGWVAIRFVADNPGIWLMHCHLDVHITWGLAMAFLVENGVGENQAIEPPPADLPQC